MVFMMCGVLFGNKENKIHKKIFFTAQHTKYTEQWGDMPSEQPKSPRQLLKTVAKGQIL